MLCSAHFLRTTGFMLFLYGQFTYATGPSYANIEVVPIAISEKGIILCKTESHINLMGAQTLAGKEYGWLVISAGGEWDEVIYERIDEDEAGDSAKLNSLGREHELRIDLLNPPATLGRIMEQYDFTNRDTINPNNYTSTVTFSRGHLCMDERCSETKIVQRTLKGIVSTEHDDAPLKAHFVADGIALFSNQDYSVVDGVKRGALFAVENRFKGMDIGVDLQEITGVVILPPSLWLDKNDQAVE